MNINNVFLKSLSICFLGFVLMGCGGGSNSVNGNGGGDNGGGDNGGGDNGGGDNGGGDNGGGDNDGGDNDGGDNGETDVPLPIPPTQNAPCKVSYADWEKASLGERIEFTNSKFNCNGFMSSINTDISGDTTEYLWGNNLNKPTIIATFKPQKVKNNIVQTLSSTSYIPTDIRPSVCFPDEEKRKKVSKEMSLEAVESTFGCKGAYQVSQITVDSDLAHYYQWVSSNNNETYTIVLDDKYKVSLFDYKNETTNLIESSTCAPSRNHWENILIQESYIDAKSKLGCEGMSANADKDDNNNVRTWGKADGSTDMLSLGIFQGYVSYKHLMTRDQVSACTPSYENWKNVKSGDNYVSVKNTMQCDGYLRSLYLSNSNLSQYTNTGYQWKNLITDDGSLLGVISQELNFVGDRLRVKSYSNYTQPFSTCTPNREKYDELAIGADLESIKNTFGCSAKLSVAIEDYNTGSSRPFYMQYSWGRLDKDKKTTSAHAVVNKQGKIVSKLIQFSPN